MREKMNNGDVVLQRYTMADAEDLLSAIKQSYTEISPWMSWLTPSYNLKAAKDFIAVQISNWSLEIEYTYSIKNKQGDFLGTVGIHLYDKQNDVASIGYWMNTNYTSKGFCTQAVKLLVENCVKHLNLIRIEIIVATENYASQKVAIKSGAHKEAVLKNRIKLHGKPIDATMNALII